MSDLPYFERPKRTASKPCACGASPGMAHDVLCEERFISEREALQRIAEALEKIAAKR
jgi:hypothetical protein